MRRALSSITLAACLCCARPALARRALTPPAPELPADAAWINAMPFTLAQLRERRVVLLAFFDSANINSLRALKALETWDEAWSLKGLMVIGVHVPSFSFQKDPAVLRKILSRYGVQFPVVLDNDGAISKAYANDGWPGFYLVDGEGNIVYDHLGEDRYADLESEIRQEVSQLPDQSSIEGPALVKDAVLDDCGKATPEVAVSSGVKPAPEESPAAHRLVFEQSEGEMERDGEWKSSLDGLILAQKNPDQEALIRVIYRGAQAWAALSPGSAKRARFFVKQDRLWMHPLNAGADVRFDDDGRSYVVVDLPRDYELAANANDDTHELEVMPEARGAAVHQFSFADRCMPLTDK